LVNGRNLVPTPLRHYPPLDYPPNLGSLHSFSYVVPSRRRCSNSLGKAQASCLRTQRKTTIWLRNWISQCPSEMFISTASSSTGLLRYPCLPTSKLYSNSGSNEMVLTVR